VQAADTLAANGVGAVKAALKRHLIPSLGVALLVAAAPADASQLVYGCGSAFENLCRASPDGKRVRQLTRDGDPSGTNARRYSGAALTRDGRRLAYVFGSDVFTRAISGGPARRSTQPFVPFLVRFRPDGARYVVAEAATIGGTQVCAYTTDLSGTNDGRSCLATGVSSGMDYLPDGRVVMAGSGGSAENGRSVIELLRPEDGMGTGVERVLVRDPEVNLESPSVSPDGRLVAVIRAPLSGGTRGDVAIYDLAAGTLVRVLTSGGADAAPAFSPDGSQVAFDRGDAVWVTRATGAPGSERRIVARGRSAAWGGGTVPPAFSRLRVSARGGLIRGSLRVAEPRSRVVIAARGRRVARTTDTSLRFSLPARPGRVTVTVTVTPPGGVPERATRRVRAR
jgi:hypothetical protein